jgi:hypothetical protein
VAKTPKTKPEMHRTATALAQQYQLVRHNGQLFVPVLWSDPVVSSTIPDPKETVWLPMTPEDVEEFGNTVGKILFQTGSEFTSFHYMLKQEAARPKKPHVDEVFIKTIDGLRVLAPTGELIEPTGDFIPNVLWPTLNEDPDVKQEILDIMAEWLGDPEPVKSLLHHLATTLAPHWSAAKIVLLLGAGRNGKSTLLKMLDKTIGSANVSNVTRQQMAALAPSIVDLNNKLVNIVFDASNKYVDDSSTEKTLVVGEKFPVRLLYNSTNTIVQTNALFIEGQQEEPKTRDKSVALQRRIVRFWFPKEYPLDYKFEEYMLSEKILGAFLSLLLDHYVKPTERAEKLVASEASYDLQIEQVVLNSKTFQHLHELVTKDPDNATRLIGRPVEEVAGIFHAWLLNGKDDYSALDAARMLKECYVTGRKSVRESGKVKKVVVIQDFTPDAKRMIAKITEEGDEDDDGVLDDGSLVDD